ncbi:MAG: 4Fe-4S binding protein [Ignavibacteriales bacterium]|nr:[Fe-Fe] hydrogenase large subunit C-terminal domain-containing protein [Ignavibacteriaceae bacterium]NLH62155.1 4Fe-4S binding protein [Ignavibacteriales bacterium]
MHQDIVTTSLDLCKRCYSCIRECPAKAIRVMGGQAVVLQERCIACGNCVKVCSQGAKKIHSQTDAVLEYVLPYSKTVAIVAPSFAASFPEDYKKIPSALRKLGFEHVIETAFGADLISNLYFSEFENDNNQTIISSSCPAVCNYIQKYFIELVPNLAKIVSPMIALGRYIKENMGKDYKVVFIGPCVAKKDEFIQDEVIGAIDSVLTFSEVKEMFETKNINFDQLEPSSFDPPFAYLGKTFPLAGGLLKTTNISDDILEKEIIIVEGKSKVLEFIDDLANNKIHAKFIDILFCEGCISGPAIDSDLNYYARKQKVIDYIKENVHSINKKVWNSNIYNSRNLDLTRTFEPKNQRRPVPSETEIKNILASLNKYSERDELNCGSCGYPTCREFAINIGKNLAEKEMCLNYLIDQLETAYEDLRTTQEQLHSAEKLASIGQLAAGVAHEINNPLGTIMLYASLLKKTLEKQASCSNSDEDLNLIINEANRCKNIVSNLLNFARQGKLSSVKFPLSSLLRKILKTIEMDPRFSGINTVFIDYTNDMLVEGDKDQLEQVFINLIGNASESMEETERKELKLEISQNHEYIITQISDTGAGIPRENYSKVFTPFFTTKKMGRGTGLGLAITYGIVKMHKGEIGFNSELGRGTTFTVKIPVRLTSDN